MYEPNQLQCMNVFLQVRPSSTTTWINSAGSTQPALERTPPIITLCPCGMLAARLVCPAIPRNTVIEIQSNVFTPSSLMWSLVALNFQTPHKEMHLNQGRFLPNGFCGYILKPEFQRSLSSQFNPISLTEGPWQKRKTFHIMVGL